MGKNAGNRYLDIGSPEVIGDDLDVLERPGTADCLDELAVFHHVLFPVAWYVRSIGYNPIIYTICFVVALAGISHGIYTRRGTR